jgi:hypothetical protein
MDMAAIPNSALKEIDRLIEDARTSRPGLNEDDLSDLRKDLLRCFTEYGFLPEIMFSHP